MNQSASGRSPSGKVRGLFVSLSPAEFFPFCVFGLHCQPLDPAGIESQQRLSDRIFKPAWHSSFSSNQHISAKDLATKKNSSNDRQLLIFSRHSCGPPEELAHIPASSPPSLGRTAFLALCRVLVLHQKSEPSLGPTEALEALDQHFDALFCPAL